MEKRKRKGRKKKFSVNGHGIRGEAVFRRKTELGRKFTTGSGGGTDMTTSWT